MTEELDNYYLKHPEPFQGGLLVLRDIILKTDAENLAACKYQIPVFYYGELKLAFLWIYRKKVMLGIVTDLTLFPPVPGSGRKDLIESILIYPNADLPVERIAGKLQEQMTNCRCFLAEKGNGFQAKAKSFGLELGTNSFWRMLYLCLNFANSILPGKK